MNALGEHGFELQEQLTLRRHRMQFSDLEDNSHDSRDCFRCHGRRFGRAEPLWRGPAVGGALYPGVCEVFRSSLAWSQGYPIIACIPFVGLRTAGVTQW